MRQEHDLFTTLMIAFYLIVLLPVWVPLLMLGVIVRMAVFGFWLGWNVINEMLPPMSVWLADLRSDES